MKIQDIIDAAKKNGYPWGKGEYIVREDPSDLHSKVVSACVYGQAAENLEMSADEMVWRLRNAITRNFEEEKMADRHMARIYGNNIVNSIWQVNDEAAKSYEEAAEYLKTRLSPYAEIEF